MAAYLLIVLDRSAEPSCSDLREILTSAGIEVVDKHNEKVIASLKGKSTEDVIFAGNFWKLF